MVHGITGSIAEHDVMAAQEENKNRQLDKLATLNFSTHVNVTMDPYVQ
jgi:hypothetical protein